MTRAMPEINDSIRLTNPDFAENYKEKYMKARRDAGIPDEQNSFVEFLALDVNTDWDNFLKEELH